MTLRLTSEFDKEIYILFIDFKKALNDIIHCISLINILRGFNFPQKLVKLLRLSLK